MAVNEYDSGSAFPGEIGRTVDESTPAWPRPVRAVPGTPNVLTIVLDDTGFGQLGCYGSPIETPTFEATELFARGSILRGIISDRKSPIAYGYDSSNLPVYFSQSPVLNAGGVPAGALAFGEHEEVIEVDVLLRHQVEAPPGLLLELHQPRRARPDQDRGDLGGDLHPVGLRP